MLGRGVFLDRLARRAERTGTVPRKVFLEREGVVDISVDRLDFLEPEEAAKLSDKVAEGRHLPNGRRLKFHGWAVISAEKARLSHRKVIASPILNSNPYHADIRLPDPVVNKLDEQIRHAHELADESTWRRRPDQPA